MKKNPLSLLALLLAAAALLVSVNAWALAREARDSGDTLLLEMSRKNQELQSRIDELSAQLEAVEPAPGLMDWTLEAAPWSDGTGADVTLRAVPGSYEAGMEAVLLVTREGQEIARVSCAWEENACTATVPLSAADGYCYVLQLSRADGTWQAIPLTSPDHPVEDIPVYLAGSLNAYCNLFVASWQQDGENLLLTAYAQVQLPRISASGTPEIAQANLILTRNGQEVHRAPISLTPGEAERSFEAALEGTILPLPALEEDDELQLWLEVTLSDGRELTVSGICWYQNGDTLYAVVG